MPFLFYSLMHGSLIRLVRIVTRGDTSLASRYDPVSYHAQKRPERGEGGLRSPETARRASTANDCDCGLSRVALSIIVDHKRLISFTPCKYVIEDVLEEYSFTRAL
jgi:hypothetical protein